MLVHVYRISACKCLVILVLCFCMMLLLLMQLLANQHPDKINY